MQFWQKRIQEFKDLKSNEHTCVRDNFMSNKPQLYRVGRIAAIEKLFTDASSLDKKVAFASVQLLDRYFAQENLEIRDLNEAHLIATISLITVIEGMPGIPAAVTVQLLESI